MSSLNISVIGEDAQARAEAAHAFGKKSSADDLCFYHSSFQGKLVNVVDSVAYPEKLSPLLQALNVTDYALAIARKPTRALGEIIIALDLLGTKTIFLTEMDLTPFTANTCLKDSPVYTELQEAREFLLSKENPLVEGETEIVLDHCFEVKGVGVVALGVVKQGTARIHDKLTAFPSGKEVEVKSIQKNDEDVKEAFSGDRVGLCLKNVDARELGRGTVLAKDGVAVAKEVNCVAELSKYSKTSLTNGIILHTAIGLQFEPVKIECASEIKPGESKQAMLKFEKPIALRKGEKIVLCNLNAVNSTRIIGLAKA